MLSNYTRISYHMFDLSKAGTLMSHRGLDAIIALSPWDAYYVTGTYNISHYIFLDARPLIPVIPIDGEPALIVQAWESIQTKNESWIKDLKTYRMFHSWVLESPIDVLVETLMEKGLEKSRIGIEKRHISASQFNELSTRLPKISFEDCEDIFREMRMIKSDEEIRIMRDVARATEKSTLDAYEAAKPGDTEESIAKNMIQNLIDSGMVDTTLSPAQFLVIGSGERCLINHPAPTQKQIREGEALFVDFGGKFHGYHSDLGGSAVVGNPTTEQETIFTKLVTVVDDTVAAIRPGLKASDVFKATKESYRKQGVPFGEDPTMYQLAGHALGLEIHEEPEFSSTNETILQEGMTFSVEIVFARGSYRFFCEDLVTVTKNGAKVLTEIQRELPTIR